MRYLSLIILSTLLSVAVAGQSIKPQKTQQAKKTEQTVKQASKKVDSTTLRSPKAKQESTKGTIKKVQSKKTADSIEKKLPIQQEETVLVCNSSKAYAYHKYQCRGLSRCRSSISRITLSEAKRRGYKPCKNCY